MAAGDLDETGQSARAAVMEEARVVAGGSPMPQLRSLVCPYCGTITPDTGRCSACSGRFDPLSRQATQNQMGPWSIRDDRLPYRPGCTYETIARLIEQGKISEETILRGPSTRQFWTLARHTPGIAHLLGMCHSCQSPVHSDAFACPICHASFTSERDRQHLGLGPTRPLPGQGLPEVLALHAEPASQPGGVVNGVVSTPIGADIGSNGGVGSKAPHHETQQRLEEATRLARRWKSAWRLERKRAWTTLVIMGLITVLALVYAVVSGNGAQSVRVDAQASQNDVPLDE